jgi:hypothetical protein
VRDWLNPSCILVVLLLIAAPGGALAHLLITWAPTQLELMTLEREVTRCGRRLDAEWDRMITLEQRAAQLRESVAVTAARVDWLPTRDRHGVFDRLAKALCDERVTIERLVFGEPIVYTAVSRADLLACEQVTALCTGDYAALTACLDRINQTNLPLRFVSMSWRRTDERLALALQLQVPFVPDETLREALANEADLPEKNDEP